MSVSTVIRFIYSRFFRFYIKNAIQRHLYNYRYNILFDKVQLIDKLMNYIIIQKKYEYTFFRTKINRT